MTLRIDLAVDGYRAEYSDGLWYVVDTSTDQPVSEGFPRLPDAVEAAKALAAA
jgi:hypothetical protein